MPDHLFLPPPETIHCRKCLRDVVVASSEQKTMQSGCPIADCPITEDLDNQPRELWGTSISFAEPSEISQEHRIARFEEWTGLEWKQSERASSEEERFT